MKNALDFLKSTRSLAVVIVLTSLSIGLFMGKISPEQYNTIALMIVGAYFVKRDTQK